jgi:hypothetical protein
MSRVLRSRCRGCGDPAHRSSPDGGGGIGPFCRDPPVDEGDPAPLSFRARHVAIGLAGGFDRSRSPLVLASFHPSKGFRKPLVLDDRRVCHALLLVEHAIRQSRAFPAHLQPAVRELVSLDILADQSRRQWRLFKNDSLIVVGERQLLRDVALLSPGKNRLEISRRAL